MDELDGQTIPNYSCIFLLNVTAISVHIISVKKPSLNRQFPTACIWPSLLVRHFVVRNYHHQCVLDFLVLYIHIIVQFYNLFTLFFSLIFVGIISDEYKQFLSLSHEIHNAFRRGCNKFGFVVKLELINFSEVGVVSNSVLVLARS